MSFSIRHFNNDYASLARLFSEHYARPSTVENVREVEESFPRHLFRKIWIAEVAGDLAAAAILTHNKTFFHPDQYDFNIWVQKEKKRQGIGTALFRSILECVSARSPKVLQCTIPERFEDGIRFLQKLEFSEHCRTFPSDFNLANFQIEKYQVLIKRLHERGISILKLSALCEPQDREKLYELFTLLDRAILGADMRPLRSFAEFWSSIDDGTQSKDSFFVAVREGKFIGLNFGGPMTGSDEFLVKMTGVLPEFKNLGVGTALKAMGMAYAKENGFLVATTWNDSRNWPILALNEKIGFKRKPAAISFISRF